jgi:hypothetical protein
MTRKQKNEIIQLSVEAWKVPMMRKILRAQLAASVSPGLDYSALTTAQLATGSLLLADEIFNQAGLKK